METLLGLAIGIGLSAACGFRVFVPLLGIGVASKLGHLTLSPGFAWMGSWVAVIAFGTATALEIATYYVPWLDNLMDTVATPAAIVAGTISTASVIGDMSPFLRWTLALIAGGGIAGVIQVGTVALRAASSGLTGGLGNLVVASGENAGSVLVTVLAVAAPMLCVVAVAFLLYWAIQRISRRRVKGVRAA
jgi:hypothetical protein